jgi:hypothetical protein
MKRIPVALLLLCALAGLASAQCGTVATSLAGGNGQNGTMFNIVNISASPIVVTGFDQSWFTTGSSDMEIYTKTGTWSGFEANAAAWTLVGSAAAVAHPVTLTYVPVPIAVAVPIGAGATQAFYITTTLIGTGNTVAYTTGVNHIGMVIGTDGTLNVLGGPGKAYPFGASFGLPTAGRIWNGRVTYSCGGTPTYQTNSLGASFDVNGNQSAGFAPAVTTACYGAPITVNIGSTAVGNGYEIITSLAALVPAGGGALITGNGQIVNVNLADPTTSFLWGLTFPPFPTPFGAASPVAIPLGMPGAPVLTAQFAILDGTHPDGFRLGQAFELHGIAPSATANGPVGDDIGMMINAGSVYTDGACGSFVAPALPLYGVVQNTYHVITNGRITWPTANTGFTPTVAGAQAAPASVGCWTDFNTATAGSISLALVGGTTFVANYNGIGFFGGLPTNTSTFSIAIDSVTGVITISGCTAMAAQAGFNMFLGASPGAGATDPGVAAFSPAGAGAATLATDMIYTFGPTGPALAGGANTIVLTPNGSGNYTWVSF